MAARAAMLGALHLAPLLAWRAAHDRAERPLPFPDPLDGGADARLLLLLETPGAHLGESDGARFVSCDNPTGTGRNLRRYLGEAGIARGDRLVWNAVPWLIHAPGARNRPPRRAEVRDGLAMLPGFVALLPRLRVAVLSGRIAREAAPLIAAARPGLPVLTMPHPSPTIVCTSPAIGEAITATLAEAARRLHVL